MLALPNFPSLRESNSHWDNGTVHMRSLSIQRLIMMASEPGTRFLDAYFLLG